MALKEVKDEPKKSAPANQSQKSSAGQASNVSKDEQVGFHKGALSTLAKEREEMIKILSIVEQLMQMHVAALKELGIDLEALAKQKGAQTSSAAQSSKKKLEDEIR